MGDVFVELDVVADANSDCTQALLLPMSILIALRRFFRAVAVAVTCCRVFVYSIPLVLVLVCCLRIAFCIQYWRASDGRAFRFEYCYWKRRAGGLVVSRYAPNRVGIGFDSFPS